jgi:hypothetical protein
MHEDEDEYEYEDEDCRWCGIRALTDGASVGFLNVALNRCIYNIIMNRFTRDRGKKQCSHVLDIH